MKGIRKPRLTNTTDETMEYGLKDLAAPWIQFKGTLGDCVRESRGLALCGIYRRTANGWKVVAKRYWDKFVHQSKIVTVNHR